MGSRGGEGGAATTSPPAHAGRGGELINARAGTWQAAVPQVRGSRAVAEAATSPRPPPRRWRPAKGEAQPAAALMRPGGRVRPSS